MLVSVILFVGVRLEARDFQQLDFRPVALDFLCGGDESIDCSKDGGSFPSVSGG
jgi:hypothetical protein